MQLAHHHSAIPPQWYIYIISLILYKFMIIDRLKSFLVKWCQTFLKTNLNLFKFSPKFLKYLIYRQMLPKKKTLGLRPSRRLPWYHIRSLRIWVHLLSSSTHIYMPACPQKMHEPSARRHFRPTCMKLPCNLRTILVTHIRVRATLATHLLSRVQDL